MSIFRSIELPCPACDTPTEFELVHSVNAGRRPDLRASILDGSFQRASCPACATPFRVEPEFVYIDIPRGHYIGVWPSHDRAQWRERAALTQRLFDETLGPKAGGQARSIGAGLEPRAVFGWPALAEKILARQGGIDDRTLEVAKIAVLRTQEDVPVPGSREFRLVGDQDGDLLLAWVGDAGSGHDALRVPRTLIGEIEAAREGWQATYEQVAEGLVVDFQRDMLVPA